MDRSDLGPEDVVYEVTVWLPNDIALKTEHVVWPAHEGLPTGLRDGCLILPAGRYGEPTRCYAPGQWLRVEARIVARGGAGAHG